MGNGKFFSENVSEQNSNNYIIYLYCFLKKFYNKLKIGEMFKFTAKKNLK